MIRPADKGGGLVVQTKEVYKVELKRQLEDKETYIPLKSNPTRNYKNELEKLVNKGIKKGLLNKKESIYLVPITCRIPINKYTVPKIHKDSINPPGYPIVNGIQSDGARMGQYLDYRLQPLVQKTRAYLRDNKHLIQLLEEIKMKEGPCILATADVNSLYKIIGHQEATKATQWPLKYLSEV